MPWRQTTPMKERIHFLQDHLKGLFSFTELCEVYRVSRKTGYKWVDRFAQEGLGGLADRSRAPKSCPHKTPKDLADALIELRRKHPRWGPRKLIGHLEKRFPEEAWPAASTVGTILKQAGLSHPRRRKRQPGHPGRPNTTMDQPNAIWTADFKGQFKTGDGIYCYPLTILDGYSRFLLACQALPSTSHSGAQPVFERLFREFGLPLIIRTDNGIPFATQAIHRLSRLQVWWIKLGIVPELIQPGRPDQNGRHERFHRTLKAGTARPPSKHISAQQRRFDRFRTEYNEVRPHEALDQNPPASAYNPSPRPYPDPVPAVEYPAHFELRYVSKNGGIRWGKGWVNMSRVLVGEYVGLEEVDDGIWSVYFGPLLIGRFDERNLTLYGCHPYNNRGKKVSPMFPV